MINWEVSLGNIFTIITVLVAGISFYWRQIFYTNRFLEDILEIKLDLKVLNKVLTDLALQNQRLENQDFRINRLSDYIDDVRHGKGLIKD